MWPSTPVKGEAALHHIHDTTDLTTPISSLSSSSSGTYPTASLQSTYTPSGASTPPLISPYTPASYRDSMPSTNSPSGISTPALLSPYTPASHGDSMSPVPAYTPLTSGVSQSTTPPPYTPSGYEDSSSISFEMTPSQRVSCRLVEAINSRMEELEVMEHSSEDRPSDVHIKGKIKSTRYAQKLLCIPVGHTKHIYSNTWLRRAQKPHGARKVANASHHRIVRVSESQ